MLDAADPMDCSIYAGIPFCPTRCSYCSFVSRTVGDKATRALVQPYVDKLCRALTAIRETDVYKRQTQVLPGHESFSTLGPERRTNPDMDGGWAY